MRTGTGVLLRNMYRYGADWVGTDISPEQIEAAKALAAEQGMNIDFQAVSAEDGSLYEEILAWAYAGLPRRRRLPE